MSKDKDKGKEPDPTRICLHHHPTDGLDNSLAAHINMETSLSIELAKAHTALRSARAALLTATKKTLQDRSVKSALAVIDEALP